MTFLVMTPKAQAPRAKLNETISNRKVSAQHRKHEKATYRMGKTFAKHISNKG